ncbi:hypothetical protein [Streptomyces sp. NPDC127190]|uniref:hypothetical protein n=1 Tax=unclassified Streptomyces TaxID=2593676 RepID=UPI0036257A2F
MLTAEWGYPAVSDHDPSACPAPETTFATADRAPARTRQTPLVTAFTGWCRSGTHTGSGVRWPKTTLTSRMRAELAVPRA